MIISGGIMGCLTAGMPYRIIGRVCYVEEPQHDQVGRVSYCQLQGPEGFLLCLLCMLSQTQDKLPAPMN